MRNKTHICPRCQAGAGRARPRAHRVAIIGGSLLAAAALFACGPLLGFGPFILSPFLVVGGLGISPALSSALPPARCPSCRGPLARVRRPTPHLQHVVGPAPEVRSV